ISTTFFVHTLSTPDLTLAYLIYLCLNISIPIFKRSWPRRALVLLSMAAVVYWSNALDDFFLVLLPVDLCEFVGMLPTKWRNALLFVVLVPALAPLSMQMEYVMVAILTLLLYANGRIQFRKLGAAYEERERLNDDLLRLNKQLAEKNEFMRQ